MKLLVTIAIVLVGAVCSADDGAIMLHGREAKVLGTTLRYEPEPHKQTLGFWTKAADAAEWTFSVATPGDYDIEVLQGCGKGQGGSTMVVSIDRDRSDAPMPIEFVVEDTGHFQAFKPRIVGRVTLADGDHALHVQPKKIAKTAACDIRQVRLVPAFSGAAVRAGTVLLEAESFADHGGWSLDTQFIGEMGSPYLLAHGLGNPVADATTHVTFPAAGTYRVFVRTKDWVARWEAPGTPGTFQVSVNGTPLAVMFGTTGATWGWQEGGSVTVPAGESSVSLHDLTGFDGRCDCIAFATDSASPPNDSAVLAAWRRSSLGLPQAPETKGPYDLVVIGGGYSGMGAAISAARMGLKVALVQDRPVLGGNGSSEVRVWAMGLIRRGRYPHIGEIVEEFADKAKKSPGTYEEFGDALKESVVRAEPNIDLFLNTHAFAVGRDGARITSVTCLDTKTSREMKFIGTFFCDATGHATIGHLAGAETVMEPKGRMGMSNMWAWDERDTPQTFPETPWALPLSMADFPYPRDHHGQWFWESGFDKDPLGDAEAIRDWNLRAVYGAFNAMKNGDGAAKHSTAVLTWVAFIGGPRESRRILGDVVLTQDDIVSKKEFPDGCVPSTWSIDLHYPKQEYAKKFPDNPFISIAVHDKRVDRDYGYPIPYRCFYSKDVENLFMAGRCISVTHEALGTVRVMKTCGMMGEVVGKAASVAIRHGTTPRGVYEQHWSELHELLELPGKARRATLSASFDLPATATP